MTNGTRPVFEGKVALITGGGSGIGAATAAAFAARGATVFVTDLDTGRAETVAGGITARGGTAVGLGCDVASMDDWRRTVATINDMSGRLDVVHNNAYMLELGAAHTLDEWSWDRQISVDLSSVYRSIRTCHELLLASRGSIVNTSSIHAIMGFYGRPAYAAAKGGMVSLTRQLAIEYGPEIRVNAVLPGPIDTPVWDDVDPAYRAACEQGTAARRLGRPEEVASAVCFLASEEASYITGTSVLVDGGYTAMKNPA